jgi:drug/metabolite transporter (DMT)-like permease
MKPLDQAIKPPSTPIKPLPGDHLGGKIGLVLVSGLIYSTAIASVDVAANHIPPFTLTALRLSTASVIFVGLLCFFRPQYYWSRAGIADIVIVGVLNVGIPFLLLAIAVRYISSSLAAVLYNTIPVFTLILAHFLLADEKLNAVKLAGTITAVAGASILILGNETGLELEHSQGWIGQLLILAASASGALGVVYARIRVRYESPFTLAAGQIFACLLIFVSLALVVEGPPAFSSYPWQGWVAMVWAAVSAPIIGFWLLFYLINNYGASLAGFSGITTPLFSVIIGILFLGEIITPPIALGTLLLLVGVWSLNYF